MTRYITSRALQGLIAIFGALLIVFVAQRLSGDPVALMSQCMDVCSETAPVAVIVLEHEAACHLLTGENP